MTDFGVAFRVCVCESQSAARKSRNYYLNYKNSGGDAQWVRSNDLAAFNLRKFLTIFNDQRNTHYSIVKQSFQYGKVKSYVYGRYGDIVNGSC